MRATLGVEVEMERMNITGTTQAPQIPKLGEEEDWESLDQ